MNAFAPPPVTLTLADARQIITKTKIDCVPAKPGLHIWAYVVRGDVGRTGPEGHGWMDCMRFPVESLEESKRTEACIIAKAHAIRYAEWLAELPENPPIAVAPIGY